MYVIFCSSYETERLFSLFPVELSVKKVLSNLLGACGKSERSLQMIAGGNGEAIGKVSRLIGYLINGASE